MLEETNWQSGTVEQIYRAWRDVFRQKNFTTADLDARLILCDVLGLDSSGFIMQSASRPNDVQLRSIELQMSRREKHEPVAYITGTQEFWGLPFSVNLNTLIPRPDSEILVQTILDWIDSDKGRQFPWKFIDVGTGSGCLIAALLSELPRASGIGIDLSIRALLVAGNNLDQLSLISRSSLVQGDFLSAFSGEVDFILANPPYIERDVHKKLEDGVRLYEPDLALIGGEDGLTAYREIVQQVHDQTIGTSRIFFEIGYDQGIRVKDLLAQFSWADVRVELDLAGNDRVVTGRMVKADS
ncbi:MAG: peptide chain release factor N(5)-glutamine methyltransferase [Cohaesibacteraceae bacterium]|nr:peptide chain release factor N(5)-glutamine methyltransferase [Cohaesibacteraceae bacterium]